MIKNTSLYIHNVELPSKIITIQFETFQKYFIGIIRKGFGKVSKMGEHSITLIKENLMY